MLDVGDQQMLGLQFCTQTRPVAKIRKMVTQYVVPPCAITATRAAQGVQTPGVEGRITERAWSGCSVRARGVDVYQQAPLQLDDEFSWVHGKAQGGRWNRDKEVTRPGECLRSELGAVSNKGACVDIVFEARFIELLGELLLRLVAGAG
jgi:hypothetical protein